jgi:hypothetical protein
VQKGENMPSSFQIVPLKAQSFIQRILKKLPKANAVAELRNLLAESEIGLVSHELVAAIEHKYKVVLTRKYANDLLSIYRQYLEYCFEDRKLSAAEIANLSHLKQLFSLKDKLIATVHNEVAVRIYSDEVGKVIEDGKVEDLEKEFLQKLQNDIGLSPEMASQIYKENATKMLQTYLDGAVADQRISPEEESQLHALTKSLNLELIMDANTRRAFEKYKLYWQIENGDLPVVEVGINLQRNELCHFSADVEWLEQRKVTRRINYGGPTLRIKIAKGLYWRAGSLAVQTVSEDVWKVIDHGKLFVTSKRLVFMGSSGNKTVRLASILDFTPYKNGINIEKDSGKSPFLRFGEDIDLFSMILGRAIRDLN